MLPNAGGDTAWSAAGSSRGETSYAAPHTAGVAALLMEYAARTETPLDDKSLTLKAVLVNTADPDLLAKANRLTHPEENVWHPHRGYGRLNAARAFDLLSAERIRPDETTSAAAGWAYETLMENQRNIFRIEAHKGQRLIVTLAWHRKLFRSDTLLFVEEAPRLNLLLEVRAPDGTALFAESDDDNNLRKAALTIPLDGRYTLIVRNQTRRPSRDYALAFELLNPPQERDKNEDAAPTKIPGSP
jgi:hypothetical protein